ncbi:MAG: hypothetical protein KAS63_08235 [Candidatus Heimdallarchaeota archaeon]|nr:hypothetical protein [Candidatus Heimdallarchaeota archaeon]MCK4955337.1 hypothetical protein [Candidatus Heimdallarchaeota archaeon]
MKIESKDWKIVCDSTNSTFHPLVFYSHAHSDHIPRKLPKTEIISSHITKSLIKNFVKNFSETSFYDSYSIGNTSFEQKSSGHIIGSTALFIDSDEGKVIYTGDVSIRNKGFLDPFKPEKCDILIVESTFGSPEYVFPSYEEEIKKTQEQILEYLDNNVPVVLMGYALGKAQMLYHAFSDLSSNVVLHGSNYNINSILQSENIDHSIQAASYTEAKEDNLFTKKGDWILFTPLKSGRDPFFSFLKNKYGAKLFAFSGWCLSSNYKYRMNVDHAITISDHADYSELLQICRECDPDQIYTVYGYSERFAGELRREGFTAFPLSKQTILDSYFNKSVNSN